MAREMDLTEMVQTVAGLREGAEKLKQASQTFPALRRNCERILASVRMLELHTSDLAEAEANK